jgi:hypothetical protein
MWPGGLHFSHKAPGTMQHTHAVQVHICVGVLILPSEQVKLERNTSFQQAALLHTAEEICHAPIACPLQSIVYFEFSTPADTLPRHLQQTGLFKRLHDWAF